MSQRSPISLVHPQAQAQAQTQEKTKSYTSYSPYKSKFYETSINAFAVEETADAKARRYSPSYHDKRQIHQRGEGGGEKIQDQDKHLNEYVREYVYKHKHRELKQSKQVQHDSKSSVRVVLPHRPDVPKRSGTASTYASVSTNGSSSTSNTVFRPTFPFPFTPAPTPSSAAAATAFASPPASALAPATATGTVHAHSYGLYSEPSSVPVPASAPASSSAFRPASSSTLSSYYSCATGEDNIKTPEIFEEFRSKPAQISESVEYANHEQYEEYPVYENYTENATGKIPRKRSGRDINTDITVELGIVTDNIALDELEQGKRRASFYPRPLSPLTPLHRGNSNRRTSQNINGRKLRRKDHEVRAREARLKLQSRANSVYGIDISTSNTYHHSHTKTKTKLKSHTSADHGQSIWAFCLGVVAVLTLLFLSNCHKNFGRILKSPRPPRTGNL